MFEKSRVWPWRWPRGVTSYMVFIGPVFRYTIKTGLKRVWHGGYEWVEKELCHELANALYVKFTVPRRPIEIT